MVVDTCFLQTVSITAGDSFQLKPGLHSSEPSLGKTSFEQTTFQIVFTSKRVKMELFNGWRIRS
jgi:hypothetical protein